VNAPRFGDTETLIEEETGAVIVMAALSCFVVSATEVAVSVTIAEEGTAVGAV
jgi:hypothetical protein